MSTITKRTAFVLAIILIILAINNTIYYYSTKKLLIEELEEKMDTIAQQMRISIEQAEIGHYFVENMIAEHLRSSSIAIQYALDPQINNVTIAQLITLRDQLGISDITLFKKTDNNDIVGALSTDPNEVGLSTKDWGYWFDAFNQLLNKEPVNVGKGESLPNFWSGPFEVSTANPSNIEKWGYYYDGTTDYIIDPYINASHINAYDDQVGPPAVMTKLMKDNPSLKEITVFNHDIFGTTPKLSKNANNETWIHLQRRPILYGSYNYGNKDIDVACVKDAMKENKIISQLVSIDGTEVYKTFVPVPSDDLPYVIGITTDYSLIQEKLNNQFRFLAVIVLTGSLLGILIVILLMRVIQNRRDTAVQTTQEAYIHEVNELFTSIRGQRHDFLNQVQTIHTMASMGKTEDLKRFTSEIIGEIRLVNDIIQIGNPAVAALIQSKVVSAADKKISFLYEISDIDDVKLGVKSLDFVRIIGNLVDNAFDEVACIEDESLRTVKLVVREDSGYLNITVYNHGRLISPDELKHLFNSGYTTRNDGQHQGIGLAITKERVQHYNGTIHASCSEENGIVFEVKIPLY